MSYLASLETKVKQKEIRKNCEEETILLNEIDALKAKNELREKSAECKLLRSLLADAQAKIIATLTDQSESNRNSVQNLDKYNETAEENLILAKTELRQWYEAKLTEETERVQKMFEDQAKEYKISQKILKAKIQELLYRLSHCGQWTVSSNEAVKNPSKSTIELPRLNANLMLSTKNPIQTRDPPPQTTRRLLSPCAIGGQNAVCLVDTRSDRQKKNL